MVEIPTDSPPDRRALEGVREGTLSAFKVCIPRAV